MKGLVRTTMTIILLPVIFCSCIAEREYVVDYDYSYRGNFKKYKTFDFMRQDTINFNGMSDFLIKDEILKRLNSQGYDHEDRKPSMLVAYKIYGEDLNFRSYNQVNLENWTNNYGDYTLDDDDLARIKEAQYNEEKVSLKKGTLMIYFIDRRTHSVIWQGFVSGLFDDETLFTRDAKYAVRTILNQYKLLAYEKI